MHGEKSSGSDENVATVIVQSRSQKYVLYRSLANLKSLSTFLQEAILYKHNIKTGYKIRSSSYMTCDKKNVAVCSIKT